MDAPIVDCEIDNEGRFKYIQIKVSNKKNPNDYKIIIRGSSEFPYHKYIYRDFLDKIYFLIIKPYLKIIIMSQMEEEE